MDERINIKESRNFYRISSDSKTKNVKRESKAYSYEDQLMDEEIRRVRLINYDI